MALESLVIKYTWIFDPEKFRINYPKESIKELVGLKHALMCFLDKTHKEYLCGKDLIEILFKYMFTSNNSLIASLQFLEKYNALDKDSAAIRISSYRSLYTCLFCQGLLDVKSMNFIAQSIQGHGVLEVGSGLGLTAAILRHGYNIDIVATDQEVKPNESFIDVEKFNASDAIEYYSPSRKVLLMIWPPYKSDMAYEALLKFSGNILILVGDFSVIANEKFFRLLFDDTREWVYRGDCQVQNWPGNSDTCVQVYHRFAEDSA